MRNVLALLLLFLPTVWVSLIHGPRAGVACAAALVVGATAWLGSSILTGPEGFRGRRLSPLAWLLSRPTVADWLIRRAMRTPYIHIDGYMSRWWLFNPYDPTTISCARTKTPISMTTRGTRGRSFCAVGILRHASRNTRTLSWRPTAARCGGT